MKKIYFILHCICLSFAGCTNNPGMEDTAMLPKTRAIHNEEPVEEAFPNARTETYSTASGIELEKLDSIYILQGDIILSSEQIHKLEQQETRGAIQTNATNYWTSLL